MKKTLALILALVMLSSVSLALAEDEKFPGYYKPPSVNEGQYPSKYEGVTLTLWCEINSGAAQFISSYNENPAWQKIMKDTGINVEFIHPAVGTTKDSFQLLMLADELPDIIHMPSEGLYTGGTSAMYEDGVIVDLTPYMEEHAPQYWEVINHTPQHFNVNTRDGKVLFFNRLGFNTATPYNRFNMNKDWLNEFNMEEPALISEYEAYFQAILDNKPGVTPLIFRPTNANDMNLLLAPYELLYGYFRGEDGKVHHYANEPTYKDALAMLNRWYEKGYLSKDFATLKLDEMLTLFDNMKLGTVCESVDVVYAHSTAHQNFTTTNCRYPRLTEDQILGNWSSGFPGGFSQACVITKDCKNVEAAVELLNYGYTFEGALIHNLGVEGEAWNWGDDGFPKYTELMTKNPQGMTMSNVSYALKNHFSSRYTWPDDIVHVATISDQGGWNARMRWAHEPNVDYHLRLPSISLSADATAERTEIMTEVNTYAEEMMLRFITGAESLDNFDAYVEQINSLGLPRAIEITQEAFEAQWPELAK